MKNESTGTCKQPIQRENNGGMTVMLCGFSSRGADGIGLVTGSRRWHLFLLQGETIMLHFGSKTLPPM